jgi:hypothetical protein
LFSDNVIAAAVVVNSTILNAKVWMAFVFKKKKKERLMEAFLFMNVGL